MGGWHREGICEALRIPGVGGVETRGIRSEKESYQTVQKLKFHLHCLNELFPFRV